MPDSNVTGDDESYWMIPLNEFDILDFLSRKEYDLITKLASNICNKPVAQINFVDTGITSLNQIKVSVGDYLLFLTPFVI
jgi:hypothetical protein